MRTIMVTQSMIYWESPTASAWWSKTKKAQNWRLRTKLIKSSPKRWLIVGFTEGRNQGKYWTKQCFFKLKTEQIAKAQPQLWHHDSESMLCFSGNCEVAGDVYLPLFQNSPFESEAGVHSQCQGDWNHSGIRMHHLPSQNFKHPSPWWPVKVKKNISLRKQ